MTFLSAILAVWESTRLPRDCLLCLNGRWEPVYSISERFIAAIPYLDGEKGHKIKLSRSIKQYYFSTLVSVLCARPVGRVEGGGRRVTFYIVFCFKMPNSFRFFSNLWPTVKQLP
jgi:hypothetical protein